MDKEKVLQLFDKYITHKPILKQFEEAYEKIQHDLTQPVAPTVCESLDSWQIYLDDLSHYQTVITETREVMYHERAIMNEITNELVNELPAQVWFRYGDIAIGLAYSDWGGSHYYVISEPWSDHLSNLDQTHHGD